MHRELLTMKESVVYPGEETFASMRSLLDAYDESPCGYVFTSESGSIRWANQTFLRMSGLGSTDTMPRLSDVLTAGGRILYETHLRPLLSMQGFVNEVAVDIERDGNEPLPVLLNGAVRRKHGHDESPLEVAWTVVDASDRRRYERELLAARRRAEEAEAAAVGLSDQLRAMNQELQETVEKLSSSSLYIRKLEGILPICMSCKAVRSDDDSEWVNLDRYLARSGAVSLSHGVCPDCEAHFA